METITFNLSAKVRKSSFKGNEYLVAPMTMITPGVLNGSKGPLLYTEEEVAKNPEMWNNMPIVANHPVDDNGTHLSARDPEVLEKYGVGFVAYSKIVNGKLQAEGWFNVDSCQRIEPRILDALNNGQAIEVSTGLFADQEPSEGVFNGESYTHIATNYKPDHLAILVDQPGACSIKDGCGVLVNREDRQGLLGQITKWLGLANAKDMSHDEVRGQLGKLLAAKFTQDESPAWVEDVYDEFFVYSQGGSLLKQRYMKNKSGALKLEGEPSKVRREVSFVDVANKEGNMPVSNKKQLVDNLIANCSCWEEADREVLNGLSEDKLKALGMKSNAQEVQNAAEAGAKELKAEEATPEAKPPKALTANEWLELAPAEVRSVVANAITIEKENKASAVRAILANSANTFTEDQLNAMDLSTLRSIAAMASPAADPAKQTVLNYLGSSPAPSVAQPEALDQNDILGLPEMEYDKAS